MLLSYVEPKINENFTRLAKDKYVCIKYVKIALGKKHEFLWMVLEFSEDSVCHVLQDDQIKDIISAWPETFQDTDAVLNPASLDLCEKGGVMLLGKEEQEILHSGI